MATTAPQQHERAAAARQHARQEPKLRRAVNVPFLAVTGVLFVLLLAGGVLLHRFQVKQTASAFLDRANVLQEEGNLQEASGLLHRYLQLRPEDDQARVRMAEIFHEIAVTPRQQERATELLYAAVGLAPAEKQGELRIKLVRLLLERRQLVGALAEAERLLAAMPDEPVTWELLSRVMFEQYQIGMLEDRPSSRLPRLGEACRRAVELNPANVDLAVNLARVYRLAPTHLSMEQRDEFQTDAERNAIADRVMDNMVARNGGNTSAYLARYDYRVQFDVPGAENDLREALALGRDNLNVLLAAAFHARLKGGEALTADDSETAQERFDEAAALYTRVLAEIDDSNPTAFLGLAEIAGGQGDYRRAIGHLERGLELQPTDGAKVVLQVQLADYLVAELESVPAGQRDEASADAEQALRELGAMVERLAPRAAPRMIEPFRTSHTLIHAKLLLLQGDNVRAAGMLRQVAAMGTDSREAGSQASSSAWVLLARNYLELGQADQAALAMQQAALEFPTDAGIRRQTAEVWLLAGQPGQALTHAERSLAIEESAEAWYIAAQARFTIEQNRDPADRSWSAFNRALAEARNLNAEEDAVEPWRLEVLDANGQLLQALAIADPLLSRQASNTAVELLRSTGDQYPDAERLQSQLAWTFARANRWEDAERAWERYHEAAGTTADTLIFRSRMLGLREAWPEARALLETGLEEVPPADRARLRVELARVEVVSGGDPDQLVRALEASLGENPGDVDTIIRLLELAMRNGSEAEQLRWENALRAADGEDGAYYQFYRASRLLQKSQLTQSEQLEVQQIEAILASQRPAWSQSHLLRGQLQIWRGNFADAIEAYKRSIEFGERRVSVYQTLVGLLFREGRLTEAEEYLTQLRNQGSLSDELEGLERLVYLQQGKSDRALQVAREAVEQNPDDPSAFVWLGQMLLWNDQPDSALAAFQHAVEIGPQDEAAWSGLFTYYVQVADAVQARATLEAMVQAIDMEDGRRAYVLAQGYDLMGDTESATRQYEIAVQDDFATTDVRVRAAEFFSRFDPERALSALEEAVALAPESDVARRALAATLITRGRPRDFERAIELLQAQSSSLDANAIDDRRLQAMAWLMKGGEDFRQNVAKARTIFEELVALPNNQRRDADRLMLADVYARESALQATAEDRRAKIESAQEQFLELVTRDNVRREHLTRYITFLNHHNLRPEAVRWLPRLEEVMVPPPADDNVSRRDHLSRMAIYVDYLMQTGFEFQANETLDRMHRLLSRQSSPHPANLEAYILLRLSRRETASLESWIDRLEEAGGDPLVCVGFRARRMALLGQRDEIGPMVEAAAQQSLSAAPAAGQRLNLELRIGDIYAEVNEHEAASTWYRRAFQLSPTNYRPLMNSLIREGDLEQAVEVYRTVNDLFSQPDGAIALANALMVEAPSAAIYDEADAVLRELRSAYPENANLMLILANIRFMEGRIGESISLLRESIRLQPNQVVALNNLANLLGEQGSTEEALTLIERAIQLAGPQADLLDTKGMVLVHAGRAAEAIAFLESAVAAPESGTLQSVHLAAALFRAGDPERARVVYGTIDRSQLGNLPLTEVDHLLLGELESAFDPADDEG